ncbi:hypothetical protein [Bacillus sp. FJAT-27264]|uniref:hypothetical protein n=1 Tax=Paenibacillus sp. (strain DSM 101736 / FJAT-27264) TaxID=1850362 RepID=UPI0015866698|nr:hypothetical protein [Bacillus sp. FJAT-27264]
MWLNLLGILVAGVIFIIGQREVREKYKEINLWLAASVLVVNLGAIVIRGFTNW